MMLRSGTTYDPLYTGEKALLPVYIGPAYECVVLKYAWQRHGKGTQLFSSGGKIAISGDCFYKGKIIGTGTCTLKDGSVYTGDLAYGRFTGTGTRVFLDGTVMKGDWHNDRPHGFGDVTYPDGVTITGFWWHGKYYKTREEFETDSIVSHYRQMAQ